MTTEFDNCKRFISPFVESQFPAIYRENGQELIALLTAYYEFEETTKYQFLNASNCMDELDDIDTTLDEFVVFFKSKYMKDMPFDNATTNRFLVKHILDLYRSKGTERSLRALMQLMFGDDSVDVYYPDRDVLRPSDSKWWQPNYLEVPHTETNRLLLGKLVTGSISKANGLVEEVTTKRINGQLIDVIYISNQRGQFVDSDLLMTSDATIPAPKVKASLATITITGGGVGNSVLGELFDVTSTYGSGGLVSASSLTIQDYNVEFVLDQFNFGYTATADSLGNPIANSITKIAISDLVLGISNSGLVEGDVLEDSTGTIIGTVMESNATQVWLTGTTGPTAWVGLLGQTINDQNGNPYVVSRVYKGFGARFEILDASLTDLQTVDISTDIIGSNNILLAPYLTVPINSSDFGFPKAIAPNESLATPIVDALGFTTQTLGRVYQLSRVNQGSGYDTDIRIKVTNPYVIGTFANDISLVATNVSGLKIGDIVSQPSGARGLIKSINGNELVIMPTTYGLNLSSGTQFTLVSNPAVSFTTSQITKITTSKVMGENLIVTGTAKTVAGKVDGISLVASGTGFKDGDIVNLTSRSSGQVLTGVAHLGGTGRSEGKWLTTTSHLNWNTYIHDNDYYQEYSYEIQSPRSLSDYEDVVKSISHPAGTKMFGKVIKETTFNESYGFAADLSLDTTVIVDDTLEIF